MNYLAILICLTIERFSSVGKKTRKFHLLAYYLKQAERMIELLNLHRYIRLLAMIIPLVLLIGVVEWLLSSLYFGFFSAIFTVTILFYCLDTFDLSQISDAGEALKAANQHVFAVFVWFICFFKVGLLAALTYRMIALIAKYSEHDESAKFALKMQQYLDWLPARLFMLGAGFVSHFMAIFPCWIKYLTSGVDENDRLISECGDIAIEANVSDQEKPHKIACLIDHILFFWLVVVALIIII